MSGLQVFDPGGNEVIDTNNRKFYFLAGKLRSVNQRITIPQRFRNNETILVLKLKDSYSFLSIPIGFYIITSSTVIDVVWATNRQDWSNVPGGDSEIDLYVYSLTEIPEDTAGMGLVTYNESGDVTFSSGSKCHMLQITSVYNNLNATRNLNLGQRSQGLIISADPRDKPGQGWSDVWGMTYVWDEGSVSTEWLRTEYLSYSPGSWTFPQMCLAFVDLPDNAQYIT